MVIESVVGNPPYNVTQNGNREPIYHFFLDTAKNLSRIYSIIVPARFLLNAGKTPAKWNNAMREDMHLVVRYWFNNSSNIFINTDIAGGIAILYRDSKRDLGKPTITSDCEQSIIDKVINRVDFVSMQTIITLRDRFNLDNVYKDFPQLKGKIGSSDKEKRIVTNAFLYTDLFHITPPIWRVH